MAADVRMEVAGDSMMGRQPLGVRKSFTARLWLLPLLNAVYSQLACTAFVDREIKKNE